MNNMKKRLTRDLNNVMLGGVCSGMSKYFGINDPTILRLLFALGIYWHHIHLRYYI